MFFGVNKVARTELIAGASKNSSTGVSNSNSNVPTNILLSQVHPDSSYVDIFFRPHNFSTLSTWNSLASEPSTSVPSVPPDPHLEQALHYLQLLQPDAGDNITSLLDLQHFANLTWDVDMTVIDRFTNNLRVSEACLAVLLTAYAVLMIVGTVGNCLVVAAVARNAALRTARNLLLFNLAVSDVLLCVLTMPLTLLELVTQHWPLGVAACRAAGTLQAVAVFSSTLTIVVIALDRYMVSEQASY
ncbi:G protein-coupled receptor rhodopsin-like [Trinorchestia longiramus]|nr:G protein-coupled receptor rhodopsin-like [Trinorchestia longiramus]